MLRIALAAGLVVLAAGALAHAATPAQGIVFSAADAPFADDVMLVRADGSQVDLSKSAALDMWPALSPDGRRVAFWSARGGGAEYVVNIDGSGLRRVSPKLTGPPMVAWAPNGRDLAALADAPRPHVYRASAAGGVWVRVDRGEAQNLDGWSPDGTQIAYGTNYGTVVVVSRTGRQLASMTGNQAIWSPAGRLAVERDSTTWQVYNAAGRRLSTLAATSIAWSAQGKLATITPAGVVQVRPGGVGQPTVSARPVRHPCCLLWAGPAHVLVDGEDGYVGYDLVHHATFELAAAYRVWPSLARDGTAFGAVNGLTLARSTLSGSTRTLATVPYCQGKDTEPFADLQVLPDASGAVYAADCAQPHDLFSVAPDGSGLTRLTSTPQDEINPALSPDGTRIAFTRVDGADCVGCNHQISITNLDGNNAASVPLPVVGNSPILQDDDPSFSPDGTKLVFSRWISSVSDQAALYEAPAAGGPATSLKVLGGHPAWGLSRIAFIGSKGVETIAPDGSDPEVVGDPDAIAVAWSQDGRLAILNDVNNVLSIHLPATGKRVPLPGLHPTVNEWSGLAWSPDATRLAFTATDANGIGDVWTVGADGVGLTRVTHDLGVDGALAWR